MSETKLTKKEAEFCRWYAKLQNPKEAARKAGFSVMPEHRAMGMLSKKSVKERIKELEKENAADDNLIAAGLKRLAFGSVSDAVKLILSCGGENSPDIDSLDLFSVSEIKYTCGKGMEIKFFDRIKALERLAEISYGDRAGAAASFYEALERSTAEKESVLADG